MTNKKDFFNLLNDAIFVWAQESPLKSPTKESSVSAIINDDDSLYKMKRSCWTKLTRKLLASDNSVASITLIRQIKQSLRACDAAKLQLHKYFHLPLSPAQSTGWEFWGWVLKISTICYFYIYLTRRLYYFYFKRARDGFCSLQAAG